MTARQGAAARAGRTRPRSRPPAPTAPPKPTAQVLKHEVSPADATVEVDGVAAPVTDGFVEVKGALGSTHPVRLTKGDASRVQQVAITDSGPFPPKVELEAPEKKKKP